MAATTPGSNNPTTTNNPSYADTSRRVGVRRTTETKAGPKTTEFMLAIAFIVAVLIAAYINNSDDISRNDGWRYAAFAAAAYMISRGLAKLGVREPYTDDGDTSTR